MPDGRRGRLKPKAPASNCRGFFRFARHERPTNSQQNGASTERAPNEMTDPKGSHINQMTFGNNQTKSKGRGGARTNAGRKAGAATKKTREIADAAAAEGLTPLEYMLEVMRDVGGERRERLNAAIAAAPYIHPKLSSVELSGKDGAAIETFTRIELVSI